MDAINQKIVSMYQQGATQKEMGSEVGITPQSVAKRLKKLFESGTLKKRDNTTKKTLDFDSQTLITMYEHGASQREIARELGKSKTFVRNRILELIENGELQKKKPIIKKQIPKPKKEPKPKREPKSVIQKYVLDYTFNQLELELSYVVLPKVDIISCDKDMNHLLILVEKSEVVPMRVVLKYPLDDLEGELVSTLGKRILEDVKDVEWTPQIDARKIRTVEQDLKYIGKQSLRYFVEGYSTKYIQGFIKFKKVITRQFVALYKDNVRRAPIVEDNQTDLYGKSFKGTD